MRTAVIDEHVISELVIALARNPRASLQELATTVRIGKTTLYRYAKTREELIDTLRERCVSAMLEAAQSALQDSLPVVEAFSKLVHNHLAHKDACAFLLSYGRSPGLHVHKRSTRNCRPMNRSWKPSSSAGKKKGCSRSA